eukprot:3899032-Pyramimonas_sp.AAC.1
MKITHARVAAHRFTRAANPGVAGQVVQTYSQDAEIRNSLGFGRGSMFLRLLQYCSSCPPGARRRLQGQEGA